MAMMAPRLQWKLVRRWHRRTLFVSVACALVMAGLAAWQHRLDRKLALRQSLFDRRTMPRHATRRAPAPEPLSPGALRELQRQRLLLVRDWGALSARLAPVASEEVRLLEIEADPETGTLRLAGSAASALQANAYAERLAKAGGMLRRVRLLGLERRTGGVRFEVGAQWSD